MGSMDGSNYIFKVEVTKEAVAPAKDYILDVSTDITAFAAGEKADGDTIAAGTENFFTAICSAKTKVDESAKTFDDGYTATHRFNMGGKTVIGDVTTNAIMFETGAAATVKIWWVSGGDGREMHIYKADGTSAADTAESSVKNSLYISELSLSEAGKYFLGSMDGSNYIFKVQVTVGGGSASKPPRADWSTVGLPAVVSAVAGEKNGTIDVTVAANVGYDGGDAVVITMLDAEGKEVASLKSIAEKEEHTRNFAPDASGTYTFTATLSREGEADKVATETKSFDFVLPLATPEFTGAQCLGGGSVELNWTAVPEAEKYIVTAEGTEVKTEATGTTAKLAGLEVDKVYTFSVVAVRGEDVSEKGTFEYEIVDEVQRLWSFAAYGTSTNTKDNTATGNVYDDNLVLMSQNGKGKVVPNSNDGLAFYYTVVDPETENFTISADITVTDWTPNSNQQAFGIMASDTIGTHGSTATVWNNSYMAIATKVEYYWDAAKQEVAASGAKYSMRMGVGALARTGVTAEDVAANVTMPANFKSDFDTLETSAPLAGLAAGNYNIVGNYKENASLTGNGSGAENIKELTTFHMELTRNNTGYIVSYTDENGKTMSELYYHADDGDELLRIDPENIYVGFFAARNATVEIKNVEFTTIHPSQDAPKEERPMDVVAGKYAIESSTMANSENYELVFYGNADGKLTITGPNGVVVENVDVTAETKYRTTAKIAEGLTTFKVSFTPNADYKPSEYEVMDSYETVNFSHTVNYDVNSGGIIYVSPGAPNSGDGTKVDPMSLNSALNHAKPGQGIYIMEGTYVINDKITVERGINGTAEDMIYFVADPEADTRPVFDFNKTGTGMTFAGDYWYLQGFDVTNTANGSKGLQISGDHCIVDRVNAYNNGNTGIQISRYKGTDTMEDWPSNNLILNCTSYRNADVGYNDADGFAAKLTVGAGNVFDGCIAAYNADDGWDLYAKVETGSIGKVTIQNSIAFKNGYDIDENGNEFTTGNGNGFKMGGESLAGGHTLINSIAFANRMKGIDSNSCPDIKVENCTSFNNASYNVAFYTNNAKNTAFAATGIVSYKDANAPVDEDDNKVVGENLKPVGTQVVADYLNETNFFFDGTKSTNSTNSAVVADDWFVSLDTQKAIYGQVQRATAGNDGRIFRNEDGTINMNGYLELTDVAKAATNAGAVINSTTGTKSLEITNDMFSNEVPNNRPEESGDSSGSSEPEAPVKDSVPDTGVENNNAVWLVVMLISGMGIAVSAFASRRKRSF